MKRESNYCLLISHSVENPLGFNQNMMELEEGEKYRQQGSLISMDVSCIEGKMGPSKCLTHLPYTKDSNSMWSASREEAGNKTNCRKNKIKDSLQS